MHEIDKTKLSEQTEFRLSKIMGIENYFYQEINQQKSYSKKLNKYVTIFDYIDKILIVLSATTSGVSIISFTSTIGKSVGIVSASFTLIFSITTGIILKRYDKILMFAKSKLNNIDTLISQALIDMNISHKEFITIFKEKYTYEKMKENIRDKNEHKIQEILKMSNIK